jgi:hypothetical protein
MPGPDTPQNDSLGTVEDEEDDEEGPSGFKSLREQIGSGTIEGTEFVVTRDLSTGETRVEFEDGPDVSYSPADMVRDAYSRFYEDENASETDEDSPGGNT